MHSFPMATSLRSLVHSVPVLLGALTLYACSSESSPSDAAAGNGGSAGAAAGMAASTAGTPATTGGSSGSTSGGSGDAGTPGASGSATAGAGGTTAGAGGAAAGAGGMPPDVSPEGDGDSEVGPNYTKDPILNTKLTGSRF